MNDTKEYKTTDTALATYLITQGFSLTNIDYTQPRYEFAFNSNDSIASHADKYITGQALVDPSAYNRVNKKLLRIIRNQIQWWEE